MDNCLSLPKLVRNQIKLIKGQGRNPLSHRTNNKLTFNDSDSFFVNKTNSKDKLQSIAHGKWAIDKFNELCKTYSSSTIYLKHRNAKRRSKQLQEERLIKNRLCIKKNIVTNISLNKSQTDKLMNNRIISSNSERDMSIIQLSTHTNVNKINEDEEERMNNYLQKQFSEKGPRSSILIKRNELSENRCTSASTSTYLKKKSNHGSVLQDPTLHSFRRHDIGGLYSSSESRIAIVSQNKIETSQEIKSKKEVRKDDKKKLSKRLIKGKEDNKNINVKKKSNVLPKPIEFLTKRSEDDILNNTQSTKQMLKLKIHLDIPKKDTKTNIILNTNKQMNSSEKLKSILMIPHHEKKQEEVNNKDIPQENKSKTKQATTELIINKEQIKNEAEENHAPDIILDNNNDIHGHNKKINDIQVTQQIEKNSIQSPKKATIRRFMKSNTITCKGSNRHKRKMNTEKGTDKHFLRDLLREVEQIQIEKRELERLTEFPSIPRHETVKEEEIAITKPPYFDTEDEDNNYNDQQPNIKKYNTPLSKTNQSEIFTFNLLKHDTQDTVPTSREAFFEKDSEYASSDHSLNIPSIIAKSKKSSIFIKNYKSQLSKISEFSYNKETTKIHNSSSSDHRSAKSNENGELEPTSPINSTKMIRKALTLTHRNSLLCQRNNKRNKTEIKEELEYSSEIYDSDMSNKKNNDKASSKFSHSFMRQNSLKSENIIGKHFPSFTILSQTNIAKPTDNEEGTQITSAVSLLYYFKELEYKTNDIELKRNQIKLNYIENFTNKYHNKETEEFEDNQEDFDIYTYFAESLFKENNEEELIMQSKNTYEDFDWSLNSSFNIHYLGHNYFDADIAHKILIEKYYIKDYEKVELPTLFFNFSTTITQNHSFKKRKMNVIQRELPLLIQLSPECMDFFNTFLIYDNPHNKNVVHNCIKKDSDRNRRFSTLLPRNSITNTSNPFFKIRSQNKKDTLDRNNMYSQKKFKMNPMKKNRKLLQASEKLYDSILTRNFFKREKNDASYEYDNISNIIRYEENENLLNAIELQKTRLLDDPSLVFNQNRKSITYREKYEDKSVFNKNNTLSKTNKIKGRLLNSLKTHYETLFFYIRDRNYPQFKETYEKYLIETEIKDVDGNSFLSLAVQCNCFQIVNFLLNLGADPNDMNKNNNTPLHYALTFHYFEIADMLIKRGANETIVNKRGLTPWQCLDSAISIV